MDTIRLIRVTGEQFKFSHAEKAVIMSAAGTGGDPTLRSPKKGGPYCEVTLEIYSQRLTLILGDSHSFWRSHQNGDALRDFDVLARDWSREEEHLAKVVRAVLHSRSGY